MEARFRAVAQRDYAKSDDVDIDADALVSIVEDPTDTEEPITGAWVAAWVWVTIDELRETESARDALDPPDAEVA